MAMASDDLERVLRESVGKRIRIVFTDGLRELVEVNWVDDEGFGYSGPDSATYARNFELVAPNPARYWAPFAEVASIDSGVDSC
jgi:hypothetical protein